MTELELKQLLSKITRPDETARTAAHAHWASLAKPLGGLGRLETMLEDAAALTGTAELAFSRRAVLVLCADNGVVAQGVSQTDQSVTRAVAENLAARRTSVCQMAKTARCEVVPVDLGMAGEPVPGVQNCRIAAGTADFTTGPAMTRQQAVDAIAAGMGLVRAQKAAGVQLLATGEMGIGNTTTSSAVAAVLLGQPVERMTGRGAGLSDAGLARKLDAIRRGIARNQPDAADPLDVLSKLGGFDIAGLCGVFLGGALEGLPVLMDGFISGVSALCAVRLCPAAEKAVFASHCSTCLLYTSLFPAGDALHLIPKIGVLGIGCRRGTSAAQLEAAFAQFCAAHGLAAACITAAASIDLKAHEPGLLEFCRAHGWPVQFYSAAQLQNAPGQFTPSAFVRSVTGVDNVCERAAVLAAGGTIILPKQAGNGVTFALALRPFAPDWRWQDA